MQRNFERMKNKIFDPSLTETEILDLLSEKVFRKAGQGFSAYVLGATDMSVVLKIFPPLNIGNPENVEFIQRNPFLRHADLFTSKWQRIPTVKWIRQKAKLLMAMYRNCDNNKQGEISSELSIKGYEICIKKGLMNELPTRFIPNCVSKLSINTGLKLRSYLEQPAKIVLQKRFHEKDLLMNFLKYLAQNQDVIKCNNLIEEAIKYQLSLWRSGAADTDMSFNIFENLILLPNGRLQIHDANDVTDSYSSAIWFIREKEKDMAQIFQGISDGGYSQIFNQTNHSGVSETARKLYSTLPKQNRENLVMLFLNLSRGILSEEVMERNWNKAIRTCD